MTEFLPRPLRRTLLGACAGALLMPRAWAAAGDTWQGASLSQARQREFASTITGRRYRIFLGVPDGPPPPAGHPVLFALDGNATFPSLALMARTVGWRAKATGQAAPVVVGIGYATDKDYDLARGRDYTPPSGEGMPAGEGGADRFLDFIEQELRPLVQAIAPLDPKRQALFGHSYGGLCALHALFTRPAMFQTYIAASPSIWYRDRAVLAQYEAFRQRVAALPSKPSLLLTAGELEQPALDGAAGSSNPEAAKRRMVDEARELAGRLSFAGLLARVQFQLLAHENHGSAMFPAMSRGVEFFVG